VAAFPSPTSPRPPRSKVDDLAQAVRYGFRVPLVRRGHRPLLTVDGGNTLRSFIDYRGTVSHGPTKEPLVNRAPKPTRRVEICIAALSEIPTSSLLNEDRFTEDLDVVDGYRSVTEVLSGSRSSSWRGRRPPAMAPMHPRRKLQGDNSPTRSYQLRAQFRGDVPRCFRVRVEESYIRLSPSTRRRSTRSSKRGAQVVCRGASTTAEFTFSADCFVEIVFQLRQA